MEPGCKEMIDHQAEAGERERRLIPAAEVGEAVGRAHATVAQALLGLPDELERSVGLDPEQAEHAERVIHRAMDGLADAMANLTGPLAAAEKTINTARTTTSPRIVVPSIAQGADEV